jgi:thiosulfate oxidation carrier complex protein SoxZ
MTLYARRAWLQQAACAGVGMSAAVWPSWAIANASVFDRKTLAEVAKALGAKSLTLSADVKLNTLDYAENGASVPMDISTSLPGIGSLALFVEKNPVPLAAVFKLTEGVGSALTMHIKMAQTSVVCGLVLLNDGRAFYAKKEVKVVLGSCGGTSETLEDVEAKRATEPTKIRAQIQGDSALVRMRMAHEMESGQRKNAAGKVVTAWHIDRVLISHNGKEVMAADWGPGVARHPYLQFTLKSAKPGDKVSVFWRDNKGAARTDEQLMV